MPMPVSRTTIVTNPSSTLICIDPPAIGRELGRVADQVADYLCEPHRVAVDVQRLAGSAHDDAVIARCDFRHGGLDRLADDRGDVHRLRFQVDLSLGDARYLEQVVDQPRHVLYLAVDHLAHLDQHRIVRSLALQDRDRGADRRERIAELMREDRQEIILPPVRIQQLAVRLFEAPVQLGKFSRLLALKLPVGCVELGVRSATATR